MYLLSPDGLPTIQQSPDERQESWIFTDVLQPFNTDADIIQSHQHQPAANMSTVSILKHLRVLQKHNTDTSCPHLNTSMHDRIYLHRFIHLRFV